MKINAKIAAKHPEILNGLQDKINAMTISSSSENRIVLESEAEKAVVSRNAFGENDKQWLLTAYEKRNDTASDSTIDIKSEPEGKQNGTAPLQNNIESDTKIQKNRAGLCLLKVSLPLRPKRLPTIQIYRKMKQHRAQILLLMETFQL